MIRPFIGGIQLVVLDCIIYRMVLLVILSEESMRAVRLGVAFM